MGGKQPGVKRGHSAASQPEPASVESFKDTVLLAANSQVKVS